MYNRWYDHNGPAEGRGDTNNKGKLCPHVRGRKKQNKKTKETTKKEEKQREHRGKPANKQTDGRDGEQTDRRTGGRADKRTEAEARQQPTHAARPARRTTAQPSEEQQRRGKGGEARRRREDEPMLKVKLEAKMATTYIYMCICIHRVAASIYIWSCSGDCCLECPRGF